MARNKGISVFSDRTGTREEGNQDRQGNSG